MVKDWLKEEWDKHKASKKPDSVVTKVSPQKIMASVLEHQHESNISITELFDKKEITRKSDGNYKMECPCCGLQGDRTEGLILFTENNTAYCHSSQRTFNLSELAALKLGMIQCIDGREKGEYYIEILKDKNLRDELTEEVEEFYDPETSEAITEDLFYKYHEKKEVILPCKGRLVSSFAAALTNSIKGHNYLFYRADSRDVVEIGKIRNKGSKNKSTAFITVKPNRFITLVEKFVTPGISEYNEKSNSYVFRKKSINNSLSTTVLESYILQDRLPLIERIFQTPVPIIYDGKLTFPKSGYDPRFNSWLPHTAPTISKPNMTLDEAKEILYKIYKGFCFKTEQDRINSIAALLTPNLKGLYSEFNVRDPLYFYNANRERCGKDYNAGITGIVHEGQALEEPPISTNERNGNTNEETRKKMMSCFMQGRKRFHSSNNKGLINNAVLEGVLTSMVFSDRVLGKNEMGSFDNEMYFSLSGNIGTALTPDLANRSVHINLFFDKEDANARVFEIPDLHGWVKENRSLVLSALYSLIRNWFDKGCPEGSVPFSSYHEWASICGGIMEAAEIGNPCIKSGDDFFVSADSETEEMKLIFELICEHKSNEWVSKSDMKKIIQDSSEEVFTYIDWDKRSDQIKFGNKIDKFVGRVLSDIKFICKDLSVRKSRREYRFSRESSNLDIKSTHNPQKSSKFGNVGNVGNVCNLDSKNLKSYNKSGVEKRVGVFATPPQTLPRLPTLPKTKNQKPTKSDREVQFWDAEECKSIKPNHTKDDVLKWIKENPNEEFEKLYSNFGVGCCKFKNQLLKEGLISENGKNRYSCL